MEMNHNLAVIMTQLKPTSGPKVQIPDFGKYLVGYDVLDHITKIGLPVVEKSTEVTYGKKFFEPEIHDKMKRGPVARQLRVGFDCAPFKANSSYSNKELACVSRIGRKVPRVCKGEMKSFASFVADHVEQKLKNKINIVVCPNVDETDYINGLKHSDSRKQQLLNAVNLPLSYKIENKIHAINGFVKEEFYDEPKNPRLIMPRHDKFKVKFGRFIAVLEEEVFKKRNFIKKVPSYDRPRILSEKLCPEIHKIIETDYTSWEASMKHQMVAIEHGIYRALLKLVPEMSEFEDLLKTVIGANLLRFGHQTVRVHGRASGEATTSLGNSLINYYIWKYVCFKHKIKSKAFFEGDDGIAAVPKDFEIAKAISIMARLGMSVKMSLQDRIGDVSFCGCRFDDVDMVNTTDPIRFLARFGWSSRQYCSSGPVVRDELAKLKAMSALAMYPGCPVIAPFAKWVYEQLDIDAPTIAKRIKKSQMSLYDRERLDNNLKPDLINRGLESPVLMSTRLYVQEKFNITVAEQINLENNFVGPLRVLTSNLLNCDDRWIDFYNNYTVDSKHHVDLPW